MWHACAAVAMWHAGMQIVLVSTHLTELHQIQPKTQSGAGADQLRIHPQCPHRARRHYENGGDRMRVRTCAFVVAPDSIAPLDAAKNMPQPGGAHSEQRNSMRRHAGQQSDMPHDKRKHGGSGAQRHAKGAGGVHLEGATVGGMTGEHAHLQQPVRRDVCGSNLRRLRNFISSTENLRTQCRHVRHGHVHE